MTFGTFRPDREEKYEGHRREPITFGYQVKVALQLIGIFLMVRMVMIASGILYPRHVPYVDPYLRSFYEYLEAKLDHY